MSLKQSTINCIFDQVNETGSCSSGRVFQYEYDQNGNMIKEVYPDDVYQYEYDQNGNKTKMVHLKSLSSQSKTKLLDILLLHHKDTL